MPRAHRWGIEEALRHRTFPNARGGAGATKKRVRLPWIRTVTAQFLSRVENLVLEVVVGAEGAKAQDGFAIDQCPTQSMRSFAR
jgi:hypothetical protein